MRRNFIAGEWVDGTHAAPNISPSDTGDTIDDFAKASASQANLACEAAAAAARSWSDTPPLARSEVLDKIGDCLLRDRERLGELLSREEGKPRADGIAEVTRAGQIFKFFAGECLRLAGERISSLRPNVIVDVTREPLGVVGIITPWNFPIAIPAWKIAPALAYGNCVVFKPADLVPGSGWELCKIGNEAGLPPGVLNLVMGSGSVVGKAIVESKLVNGISFTGSVDTGRRIGAECVKSGKSVQLEMGGKNPMVVLDDADLETAVRVCLDGAYFGTGQRCTASSRLIVGDKIHDAFVDALTNAMRALRVDHALKPGTQIGPVASNEQLEQDIGYLNIAHDEGARVVGGERLKRDTEGYYLSPALLVNTNNSMRVNREEIFGPIASVIRVTGFDEALEVANDTEFGLSSGICTTSLKYAEAFKRHSGAGMVMVNVPTAGVDLHVPFGGRKGSSFGPREQGRYAMQFYTSVKTSYTSPV